MLSFRLKKKTSKNVADTIFKKFFEEFCQDYKNIENVSIPKWCSFKRGICQFQTFLQNKFFENNKIHLYNSYITRKIHGYTHDFYNWNLQKPSAFYMYDTQLFWVWLLFSSQEHNNLTNLNFANIGDQVKIFYTIKNYQQSLVGLTTAIKPEEKTAVVMLTDKVIRTHTYFETIWCLLELIASAKRCHPLRKDNKIW